MAKAKKVRSQIPRRATHARVKKIKNPRKFDYDLDYASLNLREHPELYRVGVGEQGVLLVQPYKRELLPLWKFKDPAVALSSAKALFAKFQNYRRTGDFVGMDMARKFLQMGFTRARRYANHASGRKYDAKTKEVLPREEDPIKAASAAIFFRFWKRAESNSDYGARKKAWKEQLG